VLAGPIWAEFDAIPYEIRKLGWKFCQKVQSLLSDDLTLTQHEAGTLLLKKKPLKFYSMLSEF